jgi:glycine dehydrogenase subunit 1
MTRENDTRVHPYIPNSAPAARARMLREVGVDDVSALYEAIPASLRLATALNLPEPCRSEHELRRHVGGLLAKNRSCDELLSFLGAGCYQHAVPAVCDEINSRGEFLTAYGGLWYSDHGKMQAYFEYQSLMGELLDMDAVSLTTYDWSSAATTGMLMASRLTDRTEVLVPRNLDPDRFAQLHNFARSSVSIVQVGFDPATGMLDLADLRSKLSPATGAVYFENPTYLGALETQGAEIARLAHEAGALVVVGVDPISLGLLEPPSRYGADIVCGDVQALGIHMQYGGGTGGFLASRHDPRWLAEYPTLLTTITRTADGERLGFAWSNWEETSWVKRERSRDFTGTTTGLWTLTAGVYLALMGPQGMREVGETIMGNALYAARRLGEVPGLRAPALAAPAFKEFTVDFTGTGKTVAQVNDTLLERGILGGKDLSAEFPGLGQAALFCVTEVHRQADLDRLASAIAEVVR